MTVKNVPDNILEIFFWYILDIESYSNIFAIKCLKSLRKIFASNKKRKERDCDYVFLSGYSVIQSDGDSLGQLRQGMLGMKTTF